MPRPDQLTVPILAALKHAGRKGHSATEIRTVIKSPLTYGTVASKLSALHAQKKVKREYEYIPGTVGLIGQYRYFTKETKR